MAFSARGLSVVPIRNWPKTLGLLTALIILGPVNSHAIAPYPTPTATPRPALSPYPTPVESFTSQTECLRIARARSKPERSDPVTMLSGCTFYKKIRTFIYSCYTEGNLAKLYLKQNSEFVWRYVKIHSDRYNKDFDRTYPYSSRVALSQSCYRSDVKRANSVSVEESYSLTAEPTLVNPREELTLDYSRVNIKNHLVDFKTSSLFPEPMTDILMNACLTPTLYQSVVSDTKVPYEDKFLDGPFTIKGGGPMMEESFPQQCLDEY